MKKISAIALCVLAGALLFGCKGTDRPDTDEPVTDPVSGAEISFVNEAEDADVWILPETEENLSTTLWGTATVAKLGANEERRLSLAALGGPGTYIIRAIGTDGMFYAADGILLDAGCTVRLRKHDSLASADIEVLDAGGAAETYPVFAAKL